jgi:fibronectin type 3 domain-containing protein
VYSVTGVTLPATIAAGGSLTLTVAFTPSVAGSYTGTLAVQSNATNPSLSVGLSGSAVAPVSHSVTLSWTEASTSVSGYNVYRSVTSGTGYTKLNSSLVSNPPYVDGAVSAGQTYYYVVTAVDGSGNESAHSTQVMAVVPTT